MLILILACQSLYQLGLFAYFEINRDYIAQVLCVNRDRVNPEEPEITMCGGQCFLEKKLKLVDESSPYDETMPSSRLKIEIPSFVLSEYSIELTIAVVDYELHSTPYLVTQSSGICVSIFSSTISQLVETISAVRHKRMACFPIV